MSTSWQKQARVLAMIVYFIMTIGAYGLLITAISNPEKYGLLVLGTAIGWTLYFFMRKYRVFSPKSLTATISAVLGGEALAWLAHLRGGTIPVETQYFTGLGVGFFTYALYAGFVSWLYALGFIDGKIKFEIAIGCGASINEDFGKIQALMEFEQLTKDWHSGLINDDQFRKKLDLLAISRVHLAEMVRSGECEISTEQVEKLREKQIIPLRATG